MISTIQQLKQGDPISHVAMVDVVSPLGVVFFRPQDIHLGQRNPLHSQEAVCTVLVEKVVGKCIFLNIYQNPEIGLMSTQCNLAFVILVCWS